MRFVLCIVSELFCFKLVGNVLDGRLTASTWRNGAGGDIGTVIPGGALTAIGGMGVQPDKRNRPNEI